MTGIFWFQQEADHGSDYPGVEEPKTTKKNNKPIYLHPKPLCENNLMVAEPRTVFTHLEPT